MNEGGPLVEPNTDSNYPYPKVATVDLTLTNITGKMTSNRITNNRVKEKEASHLSFCVHLSLEKRMILNIKLDAPDDKVNRGKLVPARRLVSLSQCALFHDISYFFMLPLVNKWDLSESVTVAAS